MTTQPRHGLFIAIEGTDGSGKGTQFKLLADELSRRGYNVTTFDFPRYEEPSSHFVRQYLNGKYGSADQVGPYTGSLFYALDRYEAAPAIRRALSEGKIVLANRFSGSNMAHQGAKLRHPEVRRGYYIWLDNLEFQLLKIPRPDKSIVLQVPAEIAQRLVDLKDKRAYTDKKRDLHEADLAHLKQSVDVYDEICRLFPKDFTRIDCVRNGKMLGIGDIGKLIMGVIEPLLPAGDRSGQVSGVVEPKPAESKNPYISLTKSGFKITPAGQEFLKAAITSLDENVYAFNETLSPVTIAAAMARLSRRGDDMRVTILDEFAASAGRDEALLKRVITAYGDDSVQQLVGQHMVVEGASNLLTKKLEWGRLAAYLEQSTRYIYFDQKDKQGNYRYHTPDYFDEDTKALYRDTLDRIFDRYAGLARQLTEHVRRASTTPQAERDIAWQGATRAQACDAARPVLPVALSATVGIYASGQALENMIMRLLADELPEARTTGQKLLEQARKTLPVFLERADRPDRGGATVAYHANTRAAVARLARKHLPDNHDEGAPAAVALLSVWPRNELDLVPDMLYEHSHLSLERIQAEVAKWPLARKQKVFNAYMGERLNRRHKPGRALEKAHYSWDLVCDYGIFRDLQRHRMVDDLQWQALTPRYGFDVPELISEAGLVEDFEECFALSLRLYDALRAKGYALEAQYATLLGHKMRWKVTYNARQAFHLHELRTSPQGHPSYRRLVQAMHAKLAEVHPQLAEAMRFVNQDEDPELTRLAAERYAQYKLRRLSRTAR